MPTLCTKCLAGDKSLPHTFPAGSNPPVVAICTPVYDHMSIGYTVSYGPMWKPSWFSAMFPGGGTHYFTEHATVIDKARNQLTEQALAAEPRATHILFVDADMTFPPHALLQLVGHDVPIVGGLCHNRRPPYNPIVVRRVEAGGARYVYDLPAHGLVECDFTGGAFLLIKREVFEAIGGAEAEAGMLPGRWWSHIDDMTEDFSFCERARRAGFGICVDVGLDIGHAASVTIDRAMASRLRDFRVAPWEDGAGELADGRPVATIVIPTFNQKPKLLRAAVLSAALQTVPVEVIVVDDGSAVPVDFDGWPENVRVIRHTTEDATGQGDRADDCPPDNLGIAAALNTGIANMTTPWFCWLSSDDLISPEKIEKQLAATRAAGVKMSFHRYQVLECDAAGVAIEDFPRVSAMPQWRTRGEQNEILARQCVINGSTVMIHRTVLENELFDTSYRYSQDWEMWCRLGRAETWFPIAETLGTRRELRGEGGNLTATLLASEERRAIWLAEDAKIRAEYGGGA